MTTNQTIDGVPRDDLEEVLTLGCSTQASRDAWDRLRALLDAPVAVSDGVNWKAVANEQMGIIQALKAAQPQGEPLIHITPEVLAMLRGERKMQPGGLTYSQSKPVGGWTVPLYAEQPAPVAVVLPSRADARNGSHDYQSGWNACLDEVTRLNSKS